MKDEARTNHKDTEDTKVKMINDQKSLRLLRLTNEGIRSTRK